MRFWECFPPSAPAGVSTWPSEGSDIFGGRLSLPGGLQPPSTVLRKDRLYTTGAVVDFALGAIGTLLIVFFAFSIWLSRGRHANWCLQVHTYWRNRGHRVGGRGHPSQICWDTGRKVRVFRAIIDRVLRFRCSNLWVKFAFID